ncbi:MAG: DUF6448 family protein [Candidatus Omnitrophota bacterium]
MKNRNINIFFLSLLTAVAVLFIVRGKLFAHCDTLDGPVIQDARTALEMGDVTPVLKWVKKDAEPEIRAVFDKTLVERKSNKYAADMKFFEKLIRIHRAGEGASFTGLKPAGSVEPIIAEADNALETGSVNALTQEMAMHLTSGVKERFKRVFELRKHKDENVEGGREYVEAYVEYVHYVEGLHDMIVGKGDHNHEK